MRVNPDGPVPCDLALFGGSAGFEDQMNGRPFTGKIGAQLWSEMKRCTGLSRRAFYVSNIVKDGCGKSGTPKPRDIAAALPEFLDELEQVQPRLVVTAGTVATRVLLGTDAQIAAVHGIPHEAEVCGQQFICYPIYQPSLNKSYMALLGYDLGRLAALLRGDLRPWQEGLPARTSWLSRDAVQRCEALEPQIVALDTEGWPAQPWGLSFSPNGIDGFVIKATDRAGLDWFRGWLAQASARASVISKETRPVALHNGIHDLPVLRSLGVLIDAYEDTQVMAYHDILRTGSGVLEAESQNLGTLAYRECGMRLGELSEIPGVDFAAKTIPYTDAVMQYAGADPVATWRLFNIYEQRGLLNYQPYQIDMGQVFLVEHMMRAGIPFDVDETTDYYADVCDKLSTANIDLKAQAARFGNRDFNPGSHPQVREIITRKIGLRIRKRTKGGLASTNEKALADHKDNKFVKRLQDRRELDKLRGTYLVPLLQELVV